MWWVRDFFPLGDRPVVTVKETADGRRREGEQRVGPNEIGAQCATLRSARSPTVIREGPPISVRPPRRELPTFPFKSFPLGPPLRETSAEPSVWRVRDFFPLGGRPVVTVKENGGREKQRG